MDSQAANEKATNFNVSVIDKLIDEAASVGKFDITITFIKLPTSLSTHYIKKGYKVFWREKSVYSSTSSSSIIIDWYGGTKDKEDTDKKDEDADDKKLKNKEDTDKIAPIFNRMIGPFFNGDDIIASIHDCDNEL